MTPVEFLQSWYLEQSNGQWERSRGVTIESLDNPGWLVTIDVAGTPLENRSMAPVDRDLSKHDWLVCEVERNRFRGQGDPEKLLAILEIFQRWAESLYAIENSGVRPR
jgi:Immunity protein 53